MIYKLSKDLQLLVLLEGINSKMNRADQAHPIRNLRC